MVFLLLSVFFLFGLALERLTLAASFFFIWLHPRGECRNSVKPRLWKTLKLLSQGIQAARGKQPFIRQKLWMRQLHRRRCNPLFHGPGILQVNLLKLMAHNAIANLLGSPAFLRHLIGIERFLNAGPAIGSMHVFKTGVQALVAVVAVAITIARLLMHYIWNPGCCLVSGEGRGMIYAIRGKLLWGQYFRQGLAFGQRSFAIGWNILLWSLELCAGQSCQTNNSQ